MTINKTDSINEDELSIRRKKILAFIKEEIQKKGYPPSVREIGQAVGLSSPSTVQSHLNVLERQGYIKRSPTKSRTLSIQHNDNQDQVVDIKPSLLQPQQSQSNTTDNKEWSESLNEVPLIGNVAAGTGVLALENLEETIPLPELFTGKGKVFMLRVRGDSMIESGIFDGDYVVVRQQPTALEGEIVVAGIPQEEATVKFFATTDKSAGMNSKVVLKPANSSMDPITLDPRDVTIYGKVVSVLRKLS